jgi:hypothetical protein
VTDTTITSLSAKEKKNKSAGFGITVTEIATILLVVSAIISFFFVHWSVAFMLLGLVGIILLRAPKQIKAANPPQIAIPTIYGSPIKAVISPRWALVLEDFPLIEDIILVDTTQQDDEIEVPDVRCRLDESPDVNVDDEGGDEEAVPPQSGASCEARIGLIYEVSQDPPTHAYDYIKAGGKEGVKSKLNNIVEEAMREEGSNHTWETISFSKARISAKLITLATGKNPTYRVVRGADKQPIRDTSGSYQTYKVEPVESNYRFSELDYQAFLKDVLHNGYNDIAGLGIRIRRLNLMEFTPEGMVKEDAERPAREQLQRRSEKADIQTNQEIIAMIMETANKGKTPRDAGYMTYDAASKEARIQRDRATQVYVEGGGGKAAVVNPNRRQNRQGGTNS